MAKKTPILVPDAHRAVNWNEKAIQAVIDEVGYVLVGIKLDGMRCHLYRTGDNYENVVAVTRAGHEILALRGRYDEIKGIWDDIGLAADGVLDTELIIPGIEFQEASGILRRHEPIDTELCVQFVMLDLYRMQDLLKSDGQTPSYGHRLTGISRALDGVTHLAEPTGLRPNSSIVGEAIAKAETIEAVRILYETARVQGFEGIIVKDPRAEVRNGKVSGQWKLKPGNGAPGWEGDGVIIGYVWGEVGKANEGKIVGFRVRLDDGSESNATGLTQAQIAEYTSAVKAAGAQRPVQHVFINRIARIEAMEKTSTGSLRHPKFCGFRDLDSAQGVLA